MERKLARLAVVDEIRPIENADNIEVAVIGGWNVVVKKGEFIKGEPGVFFEIDAALPYDDDRYEFLRARCAKSWRRNGEIFARCLRIRTMKLRGVVSQGLLLPYSSFKGVLPPRANVGDDFTAKLKVRHYDELDEEMRAETGRKPDKVNLPAWVPSPVVRLISWVYNKAKFVKWRLFCLFFPKAARERMAGGGGHFPSFIPKTDEERIQNLSNYWTRFADVDFEVTEKADGSSMTVAWSPTHKPDKPFIVCSRNVYLGEGAGTDVFSETATALDLKAKMEEYGREIAIQGELVGPSRNGNRDKYDNHQFRAFRIWDILARCWLTPDERQAALHLLSLEHVRIIEPCVKIFQKCPDMAAMLEYAKGKTERGNLREGVVCKSMDGTISFKVINNDYLLMLEKRESKEAEIKPATALQAQPPPQPTPRQSKRARTPRNAKFGPSQP